MPKDELDPEDPLELMGVPIPSGEDDEAVESSMVEAIVEEYMLEGRDKNWIMRLFREPFYRMTHAIYRRRGEAYVACAIDRVLARYVAPAA